MKKRYALGGDIGSVFSALTSLAADYSSALNHKFDPLNDPYKPSLENNLSKGLLGTIPDLIRYAKDKSQRSSYIPSASPGNYVSGGPIDPNKIQWDYTSPLGYNKGYSNTSIVGDKILINGFLYPLSSLENMQSINKTQFNSHLRALEKVPRNMSKTPRFKERAYGGDITLSDNSFLVQGNPNQVDGNYYPEHNLRLDHDEVVKSNFVYSNRIKNPKSNNSFAADAKKIELSTGKAQRALKNNFDAFAQNTINYNNAAMQSLAQNQEQIAALKGLRPSTMSYANGGPVYPDPSNPYMFVKDLREGFKSQLYYDPYNQQFLHRNLYGDYRPWKGDESAWLNSNKSNIDSHLSKYPKLSSSPYSIYDTSLFNIPTVAAQRSSKIPLEVNSQLPPNSTISNTVNPRVNRTNPSQNTFTVPDQKGPRSTNPPQEYADPYYDVMALEQLGLPYSSSLVQDRRLPPISTQSGNSSTLQDTQTYSPLNQSNYNTPFTVGDGLQTLNAISKFVPLLKGSEVEKPYFDTTTISRENYDPYGALYNNNSSYQRAVNSLDAPIQQQRAFQNSLLAKKLEQDSRITQQYDVMNRQGKTRYEGQTSNQRRFNIGQQVGTNDLNARNRAAYLNAVDNAFNSLGNLGQNLNQKTASNDTLNILKTMYPDVYNRIMSQVNGQ
jgi:hypothetical protein